MVLRQDARTLVYKCTFATGSSNKESGKAEPPQSCLARGCSGVFSRELPACETFRNLLDLGFIKTTEVAHPQYANI